MFTTTFWKLATERALKSAAQAAILVFGADQVDAIAADWPAVGGFALGGLVLSYLTSIASAPLAGNDDDPSLV